jgi:hypothetical protein
MAPAPTIGLQTRVPAQSRNPLTLVIPIMWPIESMRPGRIYRSFEMRAVVPEELGLKNYMYQSFDLVTGGDLCTLSALAHFGCATDCSQCQFSKRRYDDHFRQNRLLPSGDDP